ncbi:MAG: acyloxyacyl hydrolase [Planctomycetota bacterium]
MMSARAPRFVFLLSLFVLFIAPARGDEPFPYALGVRAGNSFGLDVKYVSEYELFAERVLPWRWEFSSGICIGTKLDGLVGVVHGERKPRNTSLLFGLGPGVSISTARRRFALEFGFKPAYLREHDFGRHDYGGSLQFISHAGVRVRLGDRYQLGYRFQHLSNSSAASTNPGYNSHMLEFVVLF